MKAGVHSINQPQLSIEVAGLTKIPLFINHVKICQSYESLSLRPLSECTSELERTQKTPIAYCDTTRRSKADENAITIARNLRWAIAAPSMA